TKVNFYTAFHVYPGLGTYRISMTDPNRNGQIINLNPPNSDMVEFHLETVYTLLNPQFDGSNNTPRLLQPPVDIGCVGETFIHNPNAFDVDGDSLSYHLITPLRGIDEETGQAIQVPNYLFPQEINPGPNNTHILDPVTGEFIWRQPQRAGEYNIAFIIVEYRQGIAIDTMIRDMQILIEGDCDNQPPEIEVVREVCVIAGETLELDVMVTDPDEPQQLVELTARGGPFELEISPARLEVANGYQPQVLNGKFIWNTACEHISDQEYQVVFRATDNKEIVDNRGEISFLSTLETVFIKVVGPPPEDVQAVAEPEQITVSWEKPYACEAAADEYFRGFSVWRRLGSNQFPPDTCQPGLAGQGYERVTSGLITDMVDDRYVFVDTDVERGRTYCYRILGNFARLSAANNPFNRVESLPSEEACVQLSRDVPLITKVSVLTTDAATGSMEVNWTKPLARDLDTILNPPPYRYRLLRAEGINGTDFQPIAGADFESATYNDANDTTFVDTDLNTSGTAYTYQLEFYVNGENTPLGETAPAASVFLGAAPTDNAVNLSWDEMVPWDNFEYTIFRQNNQGIFDSIGTSVTANFLDTGLENGIEYCYKVLAFGTYGIDGIIDPLLNFSQELCSTPGDNVPPCPPTLSVSNICDNITGQVDEDFFINNLSWTNPNEVCEDTDDVEGYNIYYSATEGGELALIETLISAEEITYDHRPDLGIAGCYTVTAFDANRNESVESNLVCVDNCPAYILPNTFTPNGDGSNDLFKPFPYRFIDRVEFKVFNRWGGLVFETANPDLDWNGTNLDGQELKDGVYFYICRVFESRVSGIVEQDALLEGSINLIRGDR
ncbi:MAG: gliding motility-associated C-terminal domain-containing protein, partial [Bacteroidota bacterium]